MHPDDFLTKEETRGKRKTNNKTYKKNNRARFDDEKEVKHSAGKGHSHKFFYDEQTDDDLDEYSKLIDVRLFR